jgi:hypothetical protein
VLCKIVLENSLFLTTIWAHRIFCFLIDGCDLVLLAKSSKDGDYHQEMNSFVFLEWFENQLMPALKNLSLVLATKPLTCAHINSIGLSSQCRTGVLITSCPCKLAILSVKSKNRINITFKSMPKIFGTCVC